MRCPRCHLETSDPVQPFCRACGAPLRLPEDPPPPPLSAPVGIDRRTEGEGSPDRAHEGLAPPPPRPEPEGPRPAARVGELASLESSHWDLGRPAPARPEPAIAPARNTARAAVGLPARAAPPATAPAPQPKPVRPSPPPPRSAPAVTASAPAAGGVVEVHVRRAEPWRRAAAWAIDGLPFVAGGVALARVLVREATVRATGPGTGPDLLDFVARERVIVLSVAAAMVVAHGTYATLAHALAGATLGKRLLRLRVVGSTGDRPTLARSAARSALAVVSVAALGLGLLLALFTASGRALHDLVARTWVVDAQS